MARGGHLDRARGRPGCSSPTGRDRDPWPWVKPLLALGAVVAFVWFFRQLTGQELYDVSTVEDPLAVLFVWIQVAHAFDVPARRDLAFSLAGSASLMAVAAAQADRPLASASTPRLDRLRPVGTGRPCGVGQRRRAHVAARGCSPPWSRWPCSARSVLAVLPAPHVAGTDRLPRQRPAPAPGIPAPGGLAGDAGNATEPAQAGSPAGATRVGGFLGFANHLDTALRGSLGNTVVMRVRAQRPSYWIGETFDTWDGENWKTPTQNAAPISDSGSPFYPAPVDSAGWPQPGGQSDLQTFYMAQSSPNLVFHADSAPEVWFPAHDIFCRTDDSIVSPIGLGPGAIYTVESEVDTPHPEPAARRRGRRAPTTGLARARRAPIHAAPPPLSPGAGPGRVGHRHGEGDDDLRQGPGPHRLDRQAHPVLHRHPPPAAGADTVDEFLFGNRTGFCEQISTAMAVMLRTDRHPRPRGGGIRPGFLQPDHRPVRGPGQGRPRLGPGVVPRLRLAELRPHRRRSRWPIRRPVPTLVHEPADVLRHVPWLSPRHRDARRHRARVARGRAGAGADPPPGPAGGPAHGAAGARAGRPRAPGETLVEYATALDDMAGDSSGTWRALAWLVEEAAYGDDATSRRPTACAQAATYGPVAAPRLPPRPRPPVAWSTRRDATDRTARRGQAGARASSKLDPRLEQRPVTHQLAGPAEPERGGEPAASAVEGDEAARRTATRRPRRPRRRGAGIRSSGS